VATGCLSPVWGFVEARRLYGRARLVIPWDAGRSGIWEVYLDIEKMRDFCQAARKNKSHSARAGPLSVRRLVRNSPRPRKQRGW
jgi:hypothetical protein